VAPSKEPARGRVRGTASLPLPKAVAAARPEAVVTARKPGVAGTDATTASLDGAETQRAANQKATGPAGAGPVPPAPERGGTAAVVPAQRTGRRSRRRSQEAPNGPVPVRDSDYVDWVRRLGGSGGGSERGDTSA
jgi:hypothetical protein